MSQDENRFLGKEHWLEAARESFDEALDTGDYTTCKAIIADVQDVSLDAGRELNGLLRDATVDSFE